MFKMFKWVVYMDYEKNYCKKVIKIIKWIDK